jgi:hypothetical protein
LIKLTAKFLLAVAFACSLIAFGCGGGSQPVDNKAPNNTAKNDAPKSDAPKSDAPKSEAPKSDSANTGVAECDEYIQKYEACLTSIADKYPQAHPQMKEAFEKQRQGFKDAAATPQGKAVLATQCKQFMDAAKGATTTAYGCKW